jgi:hypothetical protein
MKILSGPAFAAIATWLFLGVFINFIFNPDFGFVFKMTMMHACMPSVLVYFWIAITNDKKVPVVYTAEEKIEVEARLKRMSGEETLEQQEGIRGKVEF